MQRAGFIAVCITLSTVVVCPRLATAQCTKDTECKGDRICVNGACRSPKPASIPPESRPETLPAARPAPPASSQPSAPQSHPTAKRRKPGLFALSIGGGGAGCTGNCADDSEPLAGPRLSALFRLNRFLALGIHGTAIFLDTAGADVSVSGFVGAEVRLLVPLGRIVELWTSLAGGYIHHLYSGGGDEIRYYGGGLGFGVGASFFVARRVALGPSFWLYAPFFTRACLELGGTTSCGDVDVDNPAKDWGLYWAAGAHATFYLGR